MACRFGQRELIASGVNDKRAAHKLLPSFTKGLYVIVATGSASCEKPGARKRYRLPAVSGSVTAGAVATKPLSLRLR